MIRFVLIFALLVALGACGTPRGPAPVVYPGAGNLSPPPDVIKDEAIPDAAPIKPVESLALEPVELSPPDYNSVSSAHVDVPVGKAVRAARVPFNAQAAAAGQTTSGAGAGAGHAFKGAVKIAKTGGKVSRKVMSKKLNSKTREARRNRSSRAVPAQATRNERASTEVVPAKIRPASIKVNKGDTLFAISEKYQIALKPLIAENNLKAPYALNAGQTLKLPAPLHYRVRPGDTVMAISRRFSLDFRSLALINNIEPPYVLRANELLILPSLVRGADGKWQSATTSRKSSAAGSGKRKPATTSKTKQTRVQAPSRNSTFVWPLNGPVISGFGAKPGGMRNDGINISAPAGTAVRAAGSGTVVYAGSELKSFGNLILIRHPNGWVSAYAHNRKLLVKEGAKVATGDSIAEVGSTGSVSTPQLHFETRRGRNPINPMLHLPKKG